MTTLHEIRTELIDLDNLLKTFIPDETGAVFTDEHKEAVRLILQNKEETEDAERAKLESIMRLYDYWEYWGKKRKEESKRLAALAAADENSAADLRKLILEHFQSRNIHSYRVLNHNLTVSAAGGVRKLVIKDNVSPLDLPSQFQEVSVELNKKAIRAYIESHHGEPLPFAYLEERGVCLKIS